MNLSFLKTRIGLVGALFWLFAITALYYQLSPLLDLKMPAGWDLSSHFYLTTRMLDLLKELRISGYDPLWNSGYAEFTLYPPLTYIVISAVHLLTFGWVDLLACFNLFIFALPFLFLVAFSKTSQAFFGDRAGRAAVLIGLLTLFTPYEFSYFGIGLPGLIYLGLLPAFFGITIYLFFLRSLFFAGQGLTIRGSVTSAGLLGIIALTHTHTLIFSLFTLAVYLISDLRIARLKRTVFILGGALCISSFWLVPFFKEVWLSSSDGIGLPPSMPDPIFAVYGFKWFRDPDIFNSLLRGSLQFQIFSLGKVTIPGVILNLPYASIFLLVFGVAGILLQLKRSSLFLPLLFLAAVIILPRNVISAFTDAGLHYFRFAFCIMIINALLACSALAEISERCSKSLPLISAPFVAAALVIISFFQFKAYNTIVNWTGVNEPAFFRPHLNDYPLKKYAERVTAKLCSIAVGQRVAIESSVYLIASLGTPHYFTSTLPLKCHLSVSPGLLAESSFSSGFVNSTLGISSKLYPWGRTALFRDGAFHKHSARFYLQRLGFFGNRYVVSASRKYFNFLNSRARGAARLIYRSGPFAVFKNLKAKPKVELLRYAPFLLVEQGGPEFREISEKWFNDRSVEEQRIIYSRAPLISIPDHEISKVAGIIISARSGARADCEAFDRLKGSHQFRIVLNASACSNGDNGRVRFISRIDTTTGWTQLADELRRAPRLSAPPSRFKASLSKREIKITSDAPTAINYSFAQGWKSRSPNQSVYAVTPSLLFIFGEGESVLGYND